MTLGDNIKAIRRAKGMSREELGEKIGKSQYSIKDYELDKTSPTIEVIGDIAEALGVTQEEVLSYNELTYFKREVEDKVIVQSSWHLKRPGFGLSWPRDTKNMTKVDFLQRILGEGIKDFMFVDVEEDILITAEEKKKTLDIKVVHEESLKYAMSRKGFPINDKLVVKGKGFNFTFPLTEFDDITYIAETSSLMVGKESRQNRE